MKTNIIQLVAFSKPVDSDVFNPSETFASVPLPEFDDSESILGNYDLDTYRGILDYPEKSLIQFTKNIELDENEQVVCNKDVVFFTASKHMVTTPVVVFVDESAWSKYDCKSSKEFSIVRGDMIEIITRYKNDQIVNKTIRILPSKNNLKGKFKKTDIVHTRSLSLFDRLKRELGFDKNLKYTENKFVENETSYESWTFCELNYLKDPADAAVMQAVLASIKPIPRGICN